MSTIRLVGVILLALVGAGCATWGPGHPEPSLHYLSGYARALAFAPDGQTLVAVRGRNANAAAVLNVGTLAEVRTLKGKDGSRSVIKGPPGAAAFSRDGKLLATAGIDDLVILWSTETWTEVRRLPETLWVTGLAFTPEGRSLVTAGPGPFARVWDVHTGEKVAVFAGHNGAVVSVAVSPDGKRLATGSVDNTVKLWDLAGPGEVVVLDQRTVPVSSVAFSPDGTRLVSSGAGLGAVVWPISPGQGVGQPTVLAAAPPADDATKALLFGASVMSVTAAATQGGVFHIIIPGQGSTPTRLSTSFACPVAISPDGALVAVIQHAPSIMGDHQVEIFELNTQRRIAEYTRGISALAFSPDGKTLAVSGILGVIQLDPYTGKERDTKASADAGSGGTDQ